MECDSKPKEKPLIATTIKLEITATPSELTEFTEKIQAVKQEEHPDIELIFLSDSDENDSDIDLTNEENNEDP